jgi:hypothetical protein
MGRHAGNRRHIGTGKRRDQFCAVSADAQGTKTISKAAGTFDVGVIDNISTRQLPALRGAEPDEVTGWERAPIARV